MRASRPFRSLEGVLIILFLIEALRHAIGFCARLINVAIQSRQATASLAFALLALFISILLPWFAPRTRKLLPQTMLVSAILAALARAGMESQITTLDYYMSCVTIGFGLVYLLSLLRVNSKMWTNVLVAAIAIDILLRSFDSYSLTARSTITLAIGSLETRLPWLIFQSLIAAMSLSLSIQARLNTKTEVYQPGYLNMWGGLALAGFLGLEMSVLAMPGVIAHWTNSEFSGVAPWLLLMTALPLVPTVRSATARMVDVFDERLRGWVWFFVLLLLVVIGSRVEGSLGASAFMVAQFVAVMLVWWIPGVDRGDRLDQAGPALSTSAFVLFLILVVLGLTQLTLKPLSGQSLIVVLVSASLLALQRLWWREDDPWQLKAYFPVGAALAFVVGLALVGAISAVIGAARPAQARGTTLRVATYDMNTGYDLGNQYRLELIARTIEASVADVVILQNVDGGLPQGYGIDQVEFLARRLNMSKRFYGASGQLIGVAILSRWPIIEASRTTLPGAGVPASALRVVIEDRLTGHRVAVISTDAGAMAQSGNRQIGGLLAMLADAQPVILGGNLGLQAEPIYDQLVAAGLSDTDAILGIDQGFTYPAPNPTERRDYILTRGLVPLDSRQVDSNASTHRLIVVEVGWPQ